MLLLHQVGTVRIGEVVRYTIAYTPALDRVGPTPANLYVRIRNTTALPFRAAYLVGPYSLYVAAYPTGFDPEKPLGPDGAIGFESNLRAGAAWIGTLAMPKHLLEQSPKPHRPSNAVNGSADNDSKHETVSWTVDIISQVLFSRAAAVNFELVVGRDRKSVEGFPAAFSLGSSSSTEPGSLADHLPSRPAPFYDFYHYSHHDHDHRARTVPSTKGVFSRCVSLKVEDTAALWNSPALGDPTQDRGRHQVRGQTPRRQRKIHLVVLTHGLYSNLGADMLYIKERIDAVERQRREAQRIKRATQSSNEPRPNGDRMTDSEPEKTAENDSLDQDEDEEIIVRGFPGNASRTERGIQYLGQRVAKYVLELTYPSQPYLPVKPAIKHSGRKARSRADDGDDHSWKADLDQADYRFTSISFVGHSLGGLVQLYAIAYIQRHSPRFFDLIRPVSFVTMASPMLGLRNENPAYVRFALDLGLVGRSGQDLGRVWRSRPGDMTGPAPTKKKRKSAWAVLGIGDSTEAATETAPPAGMKPLLRILPTGLAHAVLSRFSHRTVYSNVVNDGIVPLRTSCLLFLDWKGLGKVQKAQRDAGIISTVASWGRSELTGTRLQPGPIEPDGERPGSETDPIPVSMPTSRANSRSRSQTRDEAEPASATSAFDGLFSFFRFSGSGPSTTSSKDMLAETGTTTSAASTVTTGSDRADRPESRSGKKTRAILSRSQTLDLEKVLPGQAKKVVSAAAAAVAAIATPPRTSILESAGDILNPPLPPAEWLIDPTRRDPMIIFHDRVYQPDDIPPPAPARAATTLTPAKSGMRVEEKIARAYHNDLSWRKVLVRLEPEAHNNINVRRMFANAYGWPVVSHLVASHFSPAGVTTEPADEDGRHEVTVTQSEPASPIIGPNSTDSPPVRSPSADRVLGRPRKASDAAANPRRLGSDGIAEPMSPVSESRPMSASMPVPGPVRDFVAQAPPPDPDATTDEDDEYDHDHDHECAVEKARQEDWYFGDQERMNGSSASSRVTTSTSTSTTGVGGAGNSSTSMTGSSDFVGLPLLRLGSDRGFFTGTVPSEVASQPPYGHAGSDQRKGGDGDGKSLSGPQTNGLLPRASSSRLLNTVRYEGAPSTTPGARTCGSGSHPPDSVAEEVVDKSSSSPLERNQQREDRQHLAYGLYPTFPTSGSVSETVHKAGMVSGPAQRGAFSPEQSSFTPRRVDSNGDDKPVSPTGVRRDGKRMVSLTLDGFKPVAGPAAVGGSSVGVIVSSQSRSRPDNKGVKDEDDEQDTSRG